MRVSPGKGRHRQRVTGDGSGHREHWGDRPSEVTQAGPSGHRNRGPGGSLSPHIDSQHQVKCIWRDRGCTHLWGTAIKILTLDHLQSVLKCTNTPPLTEKAILKCVGNRIRSRVSTLFLSRAKKTSFPFCGSHDLCYTSPALQV